MASGGSSGRGGSGSRSFDFGTDDVLCSYDDLVNTEGSNGKRSDPSGKDLHESRPGRSSQNAYHQQEGYDKTEVIFAVEKCMKKYADNMLSFLEGISRRLSQLEVYCYNLEKSIGEFRSDLSHEQSEADTKFKSLEKHLQEVHRSIQILRDKQELAETQKELVKLQIGKKDSSEGISDSTSEQKKEDASDAENKQLALALPQVAPQPTPQPRTAESNQPYNPALHPTSSALNTQQPHYLPQGGSSFYPQQNQLLNQPPQPPQPQHAPPPELRYAPQTLRHDVSLPPPPQQQQQQLPVGASQGQAPPFSQYQPQWPQQAPQPFPQPSSQPPQQSTPQAPFPNQSPAVYPPYQTSQPVKSSPDTYQGGMHTPVGYSSVPPAGGNRQEPAPYGYGGPSNSMQQPIPPAPSHAQQPQLQTGQSSSGPQLGKSSYMASPPYPTQPSGQGYGMYAPEGGRPQSQALYPGNYPPPQLSQNQQPSPGSLVPYQHSAPPPIRHGGLMDKAVSMGYPRDQVAGAIYRMEESGQPFDFNALLDLLNGSASGGPRRGWPN